MHVLFSMVFLCRFPHFGICLFPIFPSTSLEVTVFSLEACQNHRSWLITINVWLEDPAREKANSAMPTHPSRKSVLILHTHTGT